MSAVLDAPPAADAPTLPTGFRFPPGYAVGPEDDGAAISREEYEAVSVLAGWRAERSGGKLDVMPLAGRRHRRASKAFRHYLMLFYGERQDLLEDFEQERWVSIGDDTDRLPDAAVLLKNSPFAGDDLDTARVPDVLFEFVSSGREARERDNDTKRADYHRLGTPEYVIVDPQERRVTVLRWESDGYAEVAVLGLDDSYTSPLLPGLSIPLAEALAPGNDAPGDG